MDILKRRQFIDAGFALAKSLPATPLALTIHYQVPYHFMVEQGRITPCVHFKPHILYLYYGDTCFTRIHAP